MIPITPEARSARNYAYQHGTPLPSRFQRQVLAGNIIDQIQQVAVRTKVIVRAQQVLDFQQRRPGYHGDTKRGEMYQIGVSFALDGEGVYSEPLGSVVGNRLYQLRVALAQYQAFPLVLGWELEWRLPTGWAWQDALPALTFEQFTSNPTVITRIALSPLNPVPSGFQVVVVEKYP